MSKMSKTINVSEDIFGGMNVVARGGKINYVDYLHIEWHPSVLPQARLSKGLALGEAMNLVLRGCARPPKAIGHEGLSERQLRQFQKYALGCAGGLKPA